MNRLLLCIAALAVLAGCDEWALEPQRKLVSLEIEPADTVILEGERAGLRIVARDNHGEVVDIPAWRAPLWSIRNHDVLQARGRELVGVGGGTSNVTAMVAGLSASARISVNPLWDVKATLAYITQAAQHPGEPIPTIADRDGMLRIFLTLDGFHLYEPPDIRVRIAGRGVPPLDTILSQDYPHVATRPNQSSFLFSYNLHLPARFVQPELTAAITYDPEDRQHGLGGHEVIAFDVRRVPVQKQVLVPVYSTANPDSSATWWVREQTHDNPQMEMFRTLLPIADHEVIHHATYTTDADISRREDWSRLLNEIAALRTAERAIDEYYYGAVALPYRYGLLGVAYIGSFVGVGEPHGLTAAHEVGHMMALDHATPCGGRDPDPSVDPRYPYANGSTGHWGWNPRTNELIDPRYSADMMAYFCQVPHWISHYHLNRALRYRINRGADVGPVAVSQSTIYLWGGIDEHGDLYVEPALLLDARPSLPDPTGTHLAEAFDASGQRIFAHRFTPGELSHIDARLFSLAISYSPATDPEIASLTVSGPGGAATLSPESQEPIAVFMNAADEVTAIRRNWRGETPPNVQRIIYSTGIPKN